MKYECVSCGNDTYGFCMRGVFLICRKCVVAHSSEDEVSIYENALNNYIKEKGISYISDQLYKLKMYNDHSMLSDELFLDAVYKIYDKPFNMLTLNEVIYKQRDLIIDNLLK